MHITRNGQHGNEELACFATPEMLKADLDSQPSNMRQPKWPDSTHVHPPQEMHTSYACILGMRIAIGQLGPVAHASMGQVHVNVDACIS